MERLGLLKIEGLVFGVLLVLWGVFGGLGWLAASGSGILKMGLSGVGMLVFAGAMFLWTRSAGKVLAAILVVAVLCALLWIGGGVLSGLGWLCSLPFTTISGAVIVALLGLAAHKGIKLMTSPASV